MSVSQISGIDTCKIMYTDSDGLLTIIRKLEIIWKHSNEIFSLSFHEKFTHAIYLQ